MISIQLLIVENVNTIEYYDYDKYYNIIYTFEEYEEAE